MDYQDEKMKIFTKNEWNHFHDAVLTAWGTNICAEDLPELFKSLPNHEKSLAYEYGMNDTVFRDNVIIHLRRNKKIMDDVCSIVEGSSLASIASSQLDKIHSTRILQELEKDVIKLIEKIDSGAYNDGNLYTS